VKEGSRFVGRDGAGDEEGRGRWGGGAGREDKENEKEEEDDDGEDGEDGKDGEAKEDDVEERVMKEE
jgi:hypothetical protein